MSRPLILFSYRVSVCVMRPHRRDGVQSYRAVVLGDGTCSFCGTVYYRLQSEMVADMSSTGQNDSWFDILDQLMEEVNQSHLEEVQGASDKAQIVKVCIKKIR